MLSLDDLSKDLPQPGLPRDNPVLSWWLAGVRSSPYLTYQSSSDLPTEADLVVIGSGLSGVATAYFLLTSPNSPYANKKGSLVMLEARDFCSGATGRNGGHCWPHAAGSYPGWKEKYGKETAMAMSDLEQDNLHLVKDLVEKEGIDCDFWLGESASAYKSPSLVEAQKAALRLYQQDGGKVPVTIIDDPQEAQKITRITNTVAVEHAPAGSFYPFKFTSALLKRCLELGMLFYTSTPVTHIDAAGHEWLVKTPRGSIKSNAVLHATNAYACTLLPELNNAIVPLRGHCSAVTPTKAFSGGSMLKHTTSVLWGKEHREEFGRDFAFEYIIQRPNDGYLIVGGKSDPNFLGPTDDTQTIESSVEALSKYCSEQFVGWGKESPGEGCKHVWVGIMGFTEDYLPFVGQVPNKAGQYILAGHNGNGMACISRLAQGLAKQILAGPSASSKVSGLPDPFQWQKSRTSNPDWPANGI